MTSHAHPADAVFNSLYGAPPSKRKLRRRYSGAGAPESKAPLLALCMATNFSLCDTLTERPVFHQRSLVLPLPGAGDWPAQCPASPQQEGALLESVRAALTSAFADIREDDETPGALFQPERLIDSLALHVIDGRWVACASSQTRPILEAQDEAHVERVASQADAALGALLGGSMASVPHEGFGPPDFDPPLPLLRQLIFQIQSAGPGATLPGEGAGAGLAALITAEDLRLAVAQPTHPDRPTRPRRAL